MTRVRITLEGDDGQPLVGSAEQVYVLNSSCANLSEIEASIEQLRRSALPHLERALLQVAQDRQVEREKKDSAGVGTA